MSTATLNIGIPKKNIEGYPDPTCYQALKEIQRAEYGYRPLVYICSPYSGDIAENVELARRFSAFAVAARQIPLAPHLHYPQFMDDADADARELAAFFNRILLSKCEQLWAYITAHTLCEDCLAAGRYTPAQEVHYVLPLEHGGTHNPSNLRALCKPLPLETDSFG